MRATTTSDHQRSTSGQGPACQTISRRSGEEKSTVVGSPESAPRAHERHRTVRVVAQLQRHRVGQGRRRRGRRSWPGQGARSRGSTSGEPQGTSVARSSGPRPPRSDGHHDGLGAETAAHAVRGGLGAVVTSSALAEETLLFVKETLFAAEMSETPSETRVALTLEFGDLAARHSVQKKRAAVEALGHARRLEVGEGTERVQPQALAGRREVLAPEHLEGLGAAKRVARAGRHHEFAVRRKLGAEESLGDAELRPRTPSTSATHSRTRCNTASSPPKNRLGPRSGST